MEKPINPETFLDDIRRYLSPQPATGGKE